jgi:hypothetical protein
VIFVALVIIPNIVDGVEETIVHISLAEIGHVHPLCGCDGELNKPGERRKALGKVLSRGLVCAQNNVGSHTDTFVFINSPLMLTLRTFFKSG